MEDPKVAQYLDLNGYKWKYVEALPIGEVTLDLNPARWEEKVDEHHVYSMGLVLEAGGSLPAIIVAITATSMVALLSGRHRIEACNLMGISDISAYVVTDVLDRFELEMLPYSLNAQEGRHPSHENKLRQAAHFAKRYPERDRDALAKRFGVKPREIEHYLRVERATDRAIELKVLVDFRKLADEIKLMVTEKLRLDNVCAAAIQCLAYVGWSVNKTRPVIKQWADAASEKLALEMIHAEAAEHEELLRKWKRQGKRGHVQTADQKWMYAARATAKKWPEHPDLKSFTEGDLVQFREHVKDLRGQCNEWIEMCMEALATHERERKEEEARSNPPKPGASPPDSG